MRVIKIPADSTDGLVVLNVPSTYPEMNRLLLGSSTDLIEEVKAKGLMPLANSTHQQYAVLLVDEEGLGKQLPLNKRASVLYGTHVHGSPIVGDAWVVWTTREDWLDLPEHTSIQVIHDLIQRSIDHADEVFA